MQLTISRPAEQTELQISPSTEYVTRPLVSIYHTCCLLQFHCRYLINKLACIDLPIKLLQCILLRAETEIAVFVEPEREWIPVGHEEPLTDVKLGVVYQQWFLYNQHQRQLTTLDKTVSRTSTSTEAVIKNFWITAYQNILGLKMLLLHSRIFKEVTASYHKPMYFCTTNLPSF